MRRTTPRNNYTEEERVNIFETELFPHSDSLDAYAFNLVKNSDDAKDLVQETFIKAFRFTNSYTQGTNAKAWLFLILKNTFLNRYHGKHGKDHLMTSYHDIQDYHKSDNLEDNITIDLSDETFQEYLSDNVLRALNNILPSYRTILILCDMQGYSYDEISKILGIKLGTVKSRIHKARAEMKSQLAEYALEYGIN